MESLPEPYKTQVMLEIRRLVVDIDAFIVPSRYYADFMSDYFQIPRDRLHIVSLGIQLEDFKVRDKPHEDRQPTVGYFARISPEKGFHVLVDAFLLLRKMKGTENVRSYCQKLWMEHQAAISSSRTPLMNFTFSMTSPRRR